MLEPGARHAAVVTGKLRASDGTPLGADDALVAIERGSRNTPVEILYGDALDELVKLGVLDSKKQAAGIAVFTTSDQASELIFLRQRLHSLAQPQLHLSADRAAPYSAAIFGIASSPSLDDWLGAPEKDETGRDFPGEDNPSGIAHDGIGAIASGAFVAPSFLDPMTGHFERDGSGDHRVTDPAALVPVTVVVPRAPAPATGYPVVIHGHGLSNHRGGMFGIVNEYARAGFAVVGIDDVKHGARSGIPDTQNNFRGPYQGPDGIPDTVAFPVDFFAGFADFVAMRDNFRQTVLDQLSLVRLLRSAELDLSPLAPALGGGVPKLDGSRIFWSGGSLGGIMGSMVVAVEDDVRGAALQVPGGGFVSLIAIGSAKMHALVASLAESQFGVVGNELVDELHPVANLMAAVTEAGDPLAYAPHVFGASRLRSTPASVLISYAVDDEVLPNIATEALIRAFGIPIAGPHLEDVGGVPIVSSPVVDNFAGATGAAVQYAPANHGLGYVRWDLREFQPGVPLDAPTDAERYPMLAQPIRVESPIREHAAQAAHFFSTALAGAAPEIIVTQAPTADFDGDGVLDEDEARRGTDPYDPASR